LLALFELHTFSSLNKDFLPLYRDTMKSADRAIVFYNDAVFEHKKMPFIEASFVVECFGNVEVVHLPLALQSIVNEEYANGNNILLMSSGKFENAKFSFD
ncbi:peptidoglycan synthetase, partial [Bacteroidia bacterium]|nr:peptidoglycan synthetase [Bacteroidia bacterium]